MEGPWWSEGRKEGWREGGYDNVVIPSICTPLPSLILCPTSCVPYASPWTTRSKHVNLRSTVHWPYIVYKCVFAHVCSTWPGVCLLTGSCHTKCHTSKKGLASCGENEVKTSPPSVFFPPSSFTLFLLHSLSSSTFMSPTPQSYPYLSVSIRFSARLNYLHFTLTHTHTQPPPWFAVLSVLLNKVPFNRLVLVDN